MNTETKNFQFTREQVCNMIEKLCDEFKIDLTSNTHDDAANMIDELYLNKYESLEKSLMAFMNEFAHIALIDNIPFKIPGYNSNNTSKIQYELFITMEAITFAKIQGFLFSDDTVQWMINRAFTHERELTAVEKNDGYEVTQKCRFKEYV